MRRRSTRFSTLLIALAAASCGAEQGTWQRPGIDEPAPSTVPATFSAGLPARFCDLASGVTLGRPSAAPAGFCVDVPRARACALDFDCGSREACVCGTCRGALCEADEECGASSRCNFTEHRCQRVCRGAADCGTDERCDAAEGLCRGACAIDADCQADESCVEGRCVALGGRTGLCATDGDCLDRARCATWRRPADLREPAWFSAGPGGLFVEWRDETGGASIWRAERHAGQLRFVPPRAVIAPGPDDGGRAGAPAVDERAGGFGQPSLILLFADGKGRIRRAVSTDGLDLRVTPEPLLSPSAGWQQSGLDSPSIFGGLGGFGGFGATPSERLVYFATRDGSAIGVAHWAAGDSPLIAEPEPVLRPADVEDAALWRNIERLGGPCALTVHDLAADSRPSGVRLYFSARGIESGDASSFGNRVPALANDSIGVAQSADGIHFRRWPWNPVFDRVVQLLEHRSELEPDIDPDGERVVYRAASTDGRRSDGLRIGSLVAP